jgi:hypothetical protein
VSNWLIPTELGRLKCIEATSELLASLLGATKMAPLSSAAVSTVATVDEDEAH